LLRALAGGKPERRAPLRQALPRRHRRHAPTRQLCHDRCGRRAGEEAKLPIRIWVDADAVPADVKEIVLRASRRRSVETVFVANKHLRVGDDPLVSLVRVAEGPDAADAFIVGSSAAGDLCVTADVRLAARLVEKGLVVIDPRGELYSPESIGERVAIRDFVASLFVSLLPRARRPGS
jgi:uncharacterized protein YaiI (UPF0178 family)